MHYLGFLKEGDPGKTVFDQQCSAPGSTFAFDVKGGEKEAFALLDHLQVIANQPRKKGGCVGTGATHQDDSSESLRQKNLFDRP